MLFTVEIKNNKEEYRYQTATWIKISRSQSMEQTTLASHMWHHQAQEEDSKIKKS